MSGSARTVVKLGGSLMGDVPRLRACFDELRASPVSVVIVPGAGPFANAVRVMQPHLGYPDHTAHEMALLAMNQFAMVLADWGALLIGDAGELLLPGIVRAQLPVVWLAWPAANDWDDVATDWSVTSDSLALRLAIDIDAPRLVLVKSPRLADANPATLLDAAFPALARRYAGDIRLCGAGDDLTSALLGHGGQVWHRPPAETPCPTARSS